METAGNGWKSIEMCVGDRNGHKRVLAKKKGRKHVCFVVNVCCGSKMCANVRKWVLVPKNARKQMFSVIKRAMGFKTSSGVEIDWKPLRTIVV